MILKDPNGLNWLNYYRAYTRRIIDGDTIVCDINSIHDQWILNQKVRLAGIDAPELRTKDAKQREAGIKALEFLSSLILNKNIIIYTDDTDAFGRYLGIIYFELNTNNWLNVNDLLVSENYALIYND